MANSHNNSSQAVFRGLHHNSSGSGGSGNSSIHFHNPLLHHHLQQQHNSSQNYGSSIQGPSTSTSSGNQIISTPTAVSLPAPAPVPGKASTNLNSSNTPKPTSSRYSGTRANRDQMQGVVAKLWFDHNLESSLSSLEKDEHNKRIKDLRKQLEYIADTNWKYLPIEKYIGQA